MLRLLRLAFCLLLATLPATSYLRAQAVPSAGPTKPPLAWDIISIHPHDPNDDNMSWNEVPNGIAMKGVDLRALLSQAYGFAEPTLRDDELFGLPAWAKEAEFDIAAHVSSGDVAAYKKLTVMPVEESIRHLVAHEATPDMLMLRNLLEERFALKVHYETRVQPVYQLILDKSGAKLKLSTDDPAHGSATRSSGVIKGDGVPSQFIAMLLSNALHRNVVDRTGLTGHFDFTLHYLPDNTPAKPDDDSPDLFTAVREQLGLRLESAKAPVLIVVVDSVQKPTPN